MHVCILDTCVCAYITVRIYTCVRACVPACMRAYICVDTYISMQLQPARVRTHLEHRLGLLYEISWFSHRCRVAHDEMASVKDIDVSLTIEFVGNTREHSHVPIVQMCHMVQTPRVECVRLDGQHASAKSCWQR